MISQKQLEMALSSPVFQWWTGDKLGQVMSDTELEFIKANPSLKNKEDESEEARKARVAAYSAEARAKQGAAQNGANASNAYKTGDGQPGHKAV